MAKCFPNGFGDPPVLHGAKKPIKCILIENDDYIVLKRESHAEYANRMSGSSACQAYAVLYRKSDIQKCPEGLLKSISEGIRRYGLLPIKQWQDCGRITVKRVIKDCAAKGIFLNLICWSIINHRNINDGIR